MLPNWNNWNLHNKAPVWLNNRLYFLEEWAGHKEAGPHGWRNEWCVENDRLLRRSLRNEKGRTRRSPTLIVCFWNNKNIIWFNKIGSKSAFFSMIICISELYINFNSHQKSPHKTFGSSLTKRSFTLLNSKIIHM